MATRGKFIGYGKVQGRPGVCRIFTDLDNSDHLFILDRHDESGYVARNLVTFTR